MDRLQMSFQSVKNVLSDRKGQTLVEYGLILVLIAVVVIVVLTVLGTTLNSKYSNIYESMPK